MIGRGDCTARKLPANTRSLDDQVPSAPAGSLCVLTATGGLVVPPHPCTVRFGRDQRVVDLSVGSDDPYVSRKHGEFFRAGRQWWLRNVGKLPIALPDGALLITEQEVRLDAGYTPLYIGSSRQRSHQLQVLVTDGAPPPRTYPSNAPTLPPADSYELDPQDRLVLTALAQRYLSQDPYAQPMTWQQVADCLNAAPANSKPWTAGTVAAHVERIRKRLALPGTSRAEVREPVGNKLNENLIKALLRNATLRAEDLRLLYDDVD
jgi:hypothetical protein